MTRHSIVSRACGSRKLASVGFRIGPIINTVNTQAPYLASDAFAGMAWSSEKRLVSAPFFRTMGHLRIFVTVVIDIACILLATNAAVAIMPEKFPAGGTVWSSDALVVLSIVCCSSAVGLYSRRLRARWRGLLLRIAFGTGAGAVLACIASYFIASAYSAEAIIDIGTAASILLAIVRLSSHYFVRVDEFFKRNVLVLGGGARAATLRLLRRRADRLGFRILGYVPHPEESVGVSRDQLTYPTTSLLEYARAHDVDEIVVAMDEQRGSLPTTELLQCRLNGIEITDLAGFLERETRRVFVDALNPGWMIFGGGFRNDLVRRVSGRALDIVVSIALLVALWPVLLLTALFIKLEDGARAPILYRQTRVGLFDGTFEMLKFRSMHCEAERDGKAVWARQGDERITRVGKLIRRLRIDELPQLFNVLGGEMSVVGPRPERPMFVADLAEIIPYYRARHSVKPGLAGWAQLCYPYGASEEDAARKLEYDLFYVKNHSLFFDLSILLHTFETILFGRGAR